MRELAYYLTSMRTGLDFCVSGRREASAGPFPVRAHSQQKKVVAFEIRYTYGEMCPRSFLRLDTSGVHNLWPPGRIRF